MVLMLNLNKCEGDIISMNPSLDLEHTYAYVCCEANHKTLITCDPATSDFTTMLAHRNNSFARQANTDIVPASSMTTSCSFDIGSKQSSSTRHCTHYGESGHTKI